MDPFELRLAGVLRTDAERAVVDIDAAAIADRAMHATVAQGTRRRPWYLPAAAMLLLGAATIGGVVLLGSAPDRDETSPTPTATLEPAVVPAPTATPAQTEDPATATPAGAGPCAAMVQIFQTWPEAGGSGTVPEGAPTRVLGANDILFTTSARQIDGGSVGSGRIDPATGTLVPLDRVVERRFGASWAFPHDPRSRHVPSPDGRALAVEEGDLGLAGCGDPIVMLADGGSVRPFPTGPFELVSDLAWAPDGSALYAVRRTTVDADGRPYFDADLGVVLAGPGTVIRWDSENGEVRTLDGSCGTCGQLFVAPDGRHLATSSRDGRIHVLELGSAWRTIVDTDQSSLAGWADPGSLVLLDGRRIDIDGETLASWRAPCCHGTGFAGPLSPDGSTMAGMTLSDDFESWRVTLLDTSDGSTREIWEPRPGRVGDRPLPTQDGSPAGPVPGGYAQVVAWAPDGSAVVVVEPTPDSTDAVLWVVPVDGSGPTVAIAISVPDMSATLGFPNIGPSVVWLPGG